MLLSMFCVGCWSSDGSVTWLSANLYSWIFNVLVLIFGVINVLMGVVAIFIIIGMWPDPMYGPAVTYACKILKCWLVRIMSGFPVLCLVMYVSK